jgi:SPP1 family predicted phage head-tail adaptor
MRLRIGKLRHRLTLESPSRTPDSGGGADIAWTEVAVLSGAIEEISGSEIVAADQISGKRQVIVSIRHREDIAPAMRFRLGNRLLPIGAIVDPEGKRKYLRCLCEERDL